MPGLRIWVVSRLGVGDSLPNCLELNLQAERAKALKLPWGALLFQPEGFSLGHNRRNKNTQ